MAMIVIMMIIMMMVMIMVIKIIIVITTTHLVTKSAGQTELIAARDPLCLA